MDALRLIERYDNPDVLMYLDPPYVRASRKSGRLYRHEMDDEQQRQLLELIVTSRAKIVQRDRLLRDCEMIEQAAIAADSDLCAYILRNVTRDEGITTLKPPCGRRQFYEARRKFFFLLRNAKMGYFGAVER